MYLIYNYKLKNLRIIKFKYFLFCLFIFCNISYANSFELLCTNVFAFQLNFEKTDFRREKIFPEFEKTKFKITDNELLIKYPSDGMIDFQGGQELIQRGFLQETINYNNYYEFLGENETDGSNLVYTFYKTSENNVWHGLSSKSGVTKDGFLFHKDYWYECISS